MRLYEYEGKELLSSYGIPVPKGSVIRSGGQLPSSPLVLKAQVRSGDRLKAGGILFAATSSEAEEQLAMLLGAKVNGEQVEEVLAEEQIHATAEFYVSFSYDTESRGPVLALSETGGSGIAEAHVLPIDPLIGPDWTAVKTFFSSLDVKTFDEMEGILEKLWNLFDTEYALIAEINPLFLTTSGFIAGDAKIQLDDEKTNPSEKRVLTLDGDIAILASGGGASLLNMDTLMREGGRPANYTEYSGNPPASVVKDLTLRVLSHPGLKGCWVVGAAANFTDIYETMSGFLEALREAKPTFPIVIRRDGPRREEAFDMLRQAAKAEGFDIHLYDATTSMKETAYTMVKLAYKQP